MKFLILISFIFLTSCSTSNTKNVAGTSFETALKLTPDKDNQFTVTSLLGSPDQKIQVPDSDGILWVYNDKRDGRHRLSLVFDKDLKLQSVLWFVRAGEPEIRLENSLKRFPKANFVAQDAPWENPHAAPDERFYTDRKEGISITLRKARNEVEFVGWSNPNQVEPISSRKPAAQYEL